TVAIRRIPGTALNHPHVPFVLPPLGFAIGILSISVRPAGFIFNATGSFVGDTRIARTAAVPSVQVICDSVPLPPDTLRGSESPPCRKPPTPTPSKRWVPLLLGNLYHSSRYRNKRILTKKESRLRQLLSLRSRNFSCWCRLDMED